MFQKQCWLITAIILTMICTSCDYRINNTLNESESTTLSSSFDPAEKTILIAKEDFEKTSHGWPEFSNEIYSISVSNGWYQLELFKSNQTIWAASPQDTGELGSTSSVDLLFGEGSGYAGALCNQSSEGFYAFTVSPEGLYMISRYYSDGKKTVLTSGSHVTISPDSNFLVAQCVGGSLTLFVNGHYIDSAYDSTFRSGHAGVILEAKDSSVTSVSFDSFLLELLPSTE